MLLVPPDLDLDSPEAKGLEAAATDGELLQALQRTCSVVVYTPYGGVVETNSRFCEVFRVPGDQVRRLDHQRLAGDGPSWNRLLVDLRAGRTRHVRFERRRGDGGRIAVEGTYTPVFGGGDLVKVVEVSLPITPVASGLPDAGLLRRAARAWLDDVLDAERMLNDLGRLAHQARRSTFHAMLEGARYGEDSEPVVAMRELASEAQRVVSALRVLLRGSGRRAEDLVAELEREEVAKGNNRAT